MHELHSSIKNDKRRKTNLYREHDQDVSDDSDQTQGSSHQDDEHYLHSVVRAAGEEAGDGVTGGVGALRFIQGFHPFSSVGFRLGSYQHNSC